MVRDRRRGSDRRSAVRYAAQIEIEWESLVGRQVGTISDISQTGCFILCSGEVEDGENVKLYLPDRGKIIALWGEVVNHVYEIGFAVRFIELGDAERLFLERLLYILSQTSEPFSGRK
jgi:hypothetical protein